VISNKDYPRSAIKAKAEGSVGVTYTVAADGSVSGCTVTKSSGRDDLDLATCRLIQQRFRYEPARSQQGEPIPQIVAGWYDWFLQSRR
jgi:protein TonB